MPLELLRIYNARNLKEYSLSLHPFFNIIYGSNGVGKTTILESIYLLLRSRTFRSSKYKNFINHDEPECTVFSKFTDASHSNNDFTIGISRSKNNPQPIIHLNTAKVNSLSTISNLVVLGLITPDSFTLLDSGPSVRRKFIDWGVFHVEPTFIHEWRAFKKILSNRNLLLKQLGHKYNTLDKIPTYLLDSLNCWNPQLAELNNKLHEFRNRQIENIKSHFFQYLSRFSPALTETVTIKFYRGWSADLTFDQYLQEKLLEDLHSGCTRYGTHRAELRIIYKNNLAKDVLSRGQKKIIIICLILAQFSFLINSSDSSKHHMLLLDDIDSELDKSNLYILFDILTSIHSQTIVTTTDQDNYSFINSEDIKMFHVEQSL